MIVEVPQLAWHGPKGLALSFPDDWQVRVNGMAGGGRPPLKPAAVKAAIAAPTGTPPIRELARGRKEVVILFDDMTRVTQSAEIVPFILEELAAGGIPDDKIRFIMALACHGARDRSHFVKKLGEDVVSRFPVYNHNPFGNCVYIGRTATLGTELYVNEEVMRCDLKIAIGSVVPHPLFGFGGGGKIILPGVTSFETTLHNHAARGRKEKGHPVTGMGEFDRNPARLDSEEAAEMAGLDFTVNCIVNTWGETAALFAGALKPAHEAAVEEAKKHYLTPRLEGMDIVVANTYAKASEAWIGLPIAYPAVGKGGDIVLIANTPEGQVTHYLIGPFGREARGPQSYEPKLPPNVKRLIVFTEYPDMASRAYFGESENVIYRHRWEDVISALRETHGEGARVAVYPNAEIQYGA